MKKSDALAVIDLAEACNMFEFKNIKAAGVCYNNMANLQLKNDKYQLADENFQKAINAADFCLGKIKPEEYFRDFDEKEGRKIINKIIIADLNESNKLYYEKVRANRIYCKAICQYKTRKYYENGYDVGRETSRKN